LNKFIKEITPQMIKVSGKLREHGTSRDVELYEEIGDLPIKIGMRAIGKREPRKFPDRL